MIFEKGRGRTKKKEWKWREEEIEEVKEVSRIHTTEKRRD